MALEILNSYPCSAMDCAALGLALPPSEPQFLTFVKRKKSMNGGSMGHKVSHP